MEQTCQPTAARSFESPVELATLTAAKSLTNLVSAAFSGAPGADCVGDGEDPEDGEDPAAPPEGPS